MEHYFVATFINLTNKDRYKWREGLICHRARRR